MRYKTAISFSKLLILVKFRPPRKQRKRGFGGFILSQEMWQIFEYPLLIDPVIQTSEQLLIFVFDCFVGDALL